MHKIRHSIGSGHSRRWLQPAGALTGSVDVRHHVAEVVVSQLQLDAGGRPRREPLQLARHAARRHGTHVLGVRHLRCTASASASASLAHVSQHRRAPRRTTTRTTTNPAQPDLNRTINNWNWNWIWLDPSERCDDTARSDTHNAKHPTSRGRASGASGRDIPFETPNTTVILFWFDLS